MLLAPNVSDSGFPGDEAGVDVTLDVGSYSVTETVNNPAYVGEYSESDSADCSGTIGVGETKNLHPSLTMISITLLLHPLFLS